MTAQMIPTTTGFILDTFSPQDLQRVGCTHLAINLSPLWSRPGIPVLNTITRLNAWINAPQKLIPINGLQWFYQEAITARVGHQYMSYRSPFDGNEQKISPAEFIELQIKWQLDYVVTLSAPFYAFKNTDACRILQAWIEESLRVARAHDQKVIIELPCLPAAQLDTLIKFFAQEVLIEGIIFFVEDKAETFVIDQRIIDAIFSHIPAHWKIGINTNLDFAALLNTLKAKSWDWLITETPANDAKKSVFYDQQQQRSITDLSYAADMTPLTHFCDCETCLQFSRAYLHHLVASKEVFATRLIGLHNWKMLLLAAHLGVILG